MSYHFEVVLYSFRFDAASTCQAIHKLGDKAKRGWQWEGSLQKIRCCSLAALYLGTLHLEPQRVIDSQIANLLSNEIIAMLSVRHPPAQKL